MSLNLVPAGWLLVILVQPDFLAMRKAVVHWFANVAISYEFGNETVVAALSNFDRWVLRFVL